jgi:hypothetical protein
MEFFEFKYSAICHANLCQSTCKPLLMRREQVLTGC